MDAPIVTLAFPAMSRDFQSDPEWISLSYLITLVAPLVPMGRSAARIAQAAAQATGLAAGPLLGGYLTEHHGRQAVFAINVPIGVVAMIAGHYLFPRTKTQPHKGKESCPDWWECRSPTPRCSRP